MSKQDQHFLDQIAESHPEHQREEVIDFCRKVVESVTHWAQNEGVVLNGMNKLGGGFINPVVMIHPAESRSFVAKGFVDPKLAQRNKKARGLISRIDRAESSYIPKELAWLSHHDDHPVLLAEKVEGEPISYFLKNASEDPSKIEEAKKVLAMLGELLGEIHEASESPVEELPDIDDDKNLLLYDIKRIKEGLESEPASSLIKQILSKEEINRVSEDILNIARPNFASIIHADAHLDQFFVSPDNSLITIVDYDVMRIGDPMADVGRVLASLRFWVRSLGMENQEVYLINSFINGYRTKRFDDTTKNTPEFSMKKVIAYEIRYYLVHLRSFADVRDIVQGLSTDDISFYEELASGIIKDEELEREGLTPIQIKKIKDLSALVSDLKASILYLKAMN